MKKCSSTAHGGMFRALCLLLAAVMLMGMFWAGTAVSASAEEPAAETQYGYKTVSQTGDYVHFDVSGIMPKDAELKMGFVGQDYFDYVLATLGKSSLAENEFLYIYDLSLVSPTVESIRPADEYAVQFYLNEANISVDNMGVIPVASYNDFLAAQAAAEAEKAEQETAAPAEKAPADADADEAETPAEEVPAEAVTAPAEENAPVEAPAAAETEAPAAPAEAETVAPAETVTAPAEAAPAADTAETESASAPADTVAPAEAAEAADAEAPAEEADAEEAETEEAPAVSVPAVRTRAASAVSYSANKSAAWFNVNALGTYAIYGTKFDRTAPQQPADSVLAEEPAEEDTAEEPSLADAYYQRIMETASAADMLAIMSEDAFADIRFSAEQIGDISALLENMPEDANSYEAVLMILYNSLASNDLALDEPTTLDIFGSKTVVAGKTTSLSGSSSDRNHKWSSSNTNVATVNGNGANATVTGVSAGTATITHTYEVERSFWGYTWYTQETETCEVTVTAPASANEGAQVYYLKTPTSDPDSNATNQWGNNVGTARVNTTGATWTNDKNIMKGPETLDPYIISWPDGTTGQSWVLPKSTYPQHYNAIFEAYQAELQKELEVELKEEDIEEITLVPYKISKNNGTSPDKHIDCTISVKCKNVFVARFNVEFPGDSGYTNVLAKNYITGTGIDVYNNTQRVPMETEYNGITYVFDGWYNEAGDMVADANWPYFPNETELDDGTVNFYAHYTPNPASMTISKSFVGLDNDAAKPEIKVHVNGNYLAGEPVGEITLNQANNYSVTLDNLDPRVTYSFVEDISTAQIENYILTDATYIPANAEIQPTQTGPNEVTITNTYEPKTVTLTVTKNVSGNFGDKDKLFEINVVGENGAIANTDNNNMYSHNSTRTYKIPHGKAIRITEVAAEGYTMTAKLGDAYLNVDVNTTVTLPADQTKNNVSVVITNTKNITPDTGINLDSLPYIIVLAVVVVGAVIVVINKKRRSYDD